MLSNASRAAPRLSFSVSMVLPHAFNASRAPHLSFSVSMVPPRRYVGMASSVTGTENLRPASWAAAAKGTDSSGSAAA